jgi:hypothetical protein
MELDPTLPVAASRKQLFIETALTSLENLVGENL